MELSVGLEETSLLRLQQMLGGGKRGLGNRAMQAAVSRTVTTGAARIARRVGEEVRLPIRDIKASILTKKGSFERPVGVIAINKFKATWLSQFLSSSQRQIKTRQVSEGIYIQRRPNGGVRVRVRKKPTPKYPIAERLPHAFVQKMPAGPVGIFERTGVKAVMQSGRFRGKIREKIRRRRGPTPLGVFVNARGEAGARTVLEETVKDLGAVLQKNIESQISRFLAGREARGAE